MFTLAGKSADEVGALGSEVSQEVTGIEERLALAALGPTQPVTGVRVGSPVAAGVNEVGGVLV